MYHYIHRDYNEHNIYVYGLYIYEIDANNDEITFRQAFLPKRVWKRLKRAECEL